MVIIDGVTIRNPSTIEPSHTLIGREERAASGNLTVDIIAEKRKVAFYWELINSDDLNMILDLISSSVFHELTYPDPRGGEVFSMTVKLDGEPKIKSWRVITGNRIWQDVSLSFVER